MARFLRGGSALTAAVFMVMFTLGAATNFNSAAADEPVVKTCEQDKTPDCDDSCPQSAPYCEITAAFCYCSV